MFGRLERYILRQATGAFIACLLALTVVVWLTQALRELDLLTLKGQTLLVFLSLTGLALPALVLIIAPIALFIAIIYTLNRLNSDSELVVMAASGMSRLRLARPFLVLAVIVSVFSGVFSLYVAPMAMQGFRYLITEIRADIIATVLRDGTFTDVSPGLTFHVRERDRDGSLNGLMVSDTRDEERDFAYLAETGQILEMPTGTYLVMQDGNIQRRERDRGGVTVIAFEQYALDLSQFAPSAEASYFKPKERTTAQLFNPDPDDPTYEQLAPHMRGEIHERLVAPLYPLAFTLIGLAFLGAARTNRQSRWVAILLAVICVGLLRGGGFGAVSLTVGNAATAPLVYALPLFAILASLVMIMREGSPTAGPGWLDRLSGSAERVLSGLRRAPSGNAAS